MARPLLLSLLAVCFLAAIHGSYGQGRSQYQGMNECQINRIDAVEPSNQIQCEAGLIETWDHNHQMFQCAGVAVVRYTIEPNGLLLPNFINSPQLIHIIEGEQGLQGIVIPGCPETYQMSQQQSEFGEQGERGLRGREEGGRFEQDRHQKVRRFRQGDVIALPNGVAHWIYNDGNRPIVAVVLLDISSNLNQLDVNPRRFYLAGNPEDEHQHQHQQGGHSSWQGQSGRGGQTRRSQQIHQTGGRFGSSRGGECNNIFCGFDAEFLAEAFNVDVELARRLQGENDNRNNIVRVEGGSLQVLRPPVRAEWEEETERESQRHRGGGGRRGWESQRYPRRGGYGMDDNGVEETLCAMRLRENIGDPSRADVYVPQVGHLSTLNSHNLPILSWLQLSAERGSLQSNAMVSPMWNLNAHSVIYAIRGGARIQIVNDNGESVFDDEVREGQIVVVPQNFAVAKRAESEGFEWISFKTSENAMISPLAGRTSVIRALPDEVVATAYQVSKEDARRLKYSRRETTLFSPTRGGFSERRADA